MRALIFGGDSGMADVIAQKFSATWKTRADVRDYHEVRHEFERFHKLSRVYPDVVVNLAGVSHVQRIYASRRQAWYEEVETNLIGSYNVARAAIEASGFNARMIFIASVAGLYGKPEHSGYSASKAGVISLVQSLGLEGYMAFAISPGRVNTPMRERDYPGEDQRTRLTVEEIANLVGLIARGAYGEPGDNIIIRRLGHETQPIHVEPTAKIRKETFKVGTNPAR